MTASDLKRITKHKAKMLYDQGKVIYVLPDKQHPTDTLFGINAISIYKNKYPISDFDQVISALHIQNVGKTSWSRLNYYCSGRDKHNLF